MKRLTLFCVLIAMFLLGCEAIIDSGTKRFSVGLEPESVTIAAGSSEQVEVRINPLTGVDLAPAEAEITLATAPEGITADELTIPGLLNTDVLTIRVDAEVDPTPADEPLEVKVRAVREGIGAESTLQINVVSSQTP